MYQMMEWTMLEASLLSNNGNSPEVSSVGSSITTYHKRCIKNQNFIHLKEHLLGAEEPVSTTQANRLTRGLSMQPLPPSHSSPSEGVQLPVLGFPMPDHESKDIVLTTVMVPMPQPTTNPLNYPHLIFNYYKSQQQLILNNNHTHQPQPLASKWLGGTIPIMAESPVACDPINRTLSSERTCLDTESIHATMRNNYDSQESPHLCHSPTENSISNISTINIGSLWNLSDSSSHLLSHTTFYRATEMLARSSASPSPSIVNTQPPSPYGRYDVNTIEHYTHPNRTNEPSRSLSRTRYSACSSQPSQLEGGGWVEYSHRCSREGPRAQGGMVFPPDSTRPKRDVLMGNGFLPDSPRGADGESPSPSCLRSSWWGRRGLEWAPRGRPLSLSPSRPQSYSRTPSRGRPPRTGRCNSHWDSFLSRFQCTPRALGSPWRNEQGVCHVREGGSEDPSHCTVRTEASLPVANCPPLIMNGMFFYDEMTKLSLVLSPTLINSTSMRTVVAMADDYAVGPKQQSELPSPVDLELDFSGRRIENGDHKEGDKCRDLVLGVYQPSYDCHVEIIHNKDHQGTVCGTVIAPNPPNHTTHIGVSLGHQVHKDKVVTVVCNRERKEIDEVDTKGEMTYDHGVNTLFEGFQSPRQPILLRSSGDGEVRTDCMPSPPKPSSYHISNYLDHNVEKRSNSCEYKKTTSGINLEEPSNPFLSLYSEHVWGRRWHQMEKYQSQLETMNEYLSPSGSLHLFHKVSRFTGSNDIMTATRSISDAAKKRSLSRTPLPSPRDFITPNSMLITFPSVNKDETVEAGEKNRSSSFLFSSASSERIDDLVLIKPHHVSIRYNSFFVENKMLRASGSVSRQRLSWAPWKHNHCVVNSLCRPHQSNGERSSAPSSHTPFAQQLFEDISDCHSRASSARCWSTSRYALDISTRADSTVESGE
ncbi:unnamed protein product [Phytomonas sp. Hart1]|nr:unnamed protein product [Phytomonas sp. Hart1]|eukprot:CCW71387.1 unnamed protein product [Phytomonas sp. isolate Hart1]